MDLISNNAMDHNNQISVSEFKKHCLRLIGDVQGKSVSYVVTKRNVPVAMLVPLADESKDTSQYGCMRNTVQVNDDIVNCSFAEDWNVDND